MGCYPHVSVTCEVPWINCVRYTVFVFDPILMYMLFESLLPSVEGGADIKEDPMKTRIGQQKCVMMGLAFAAFGLSGCLTNDDAESPEVQISDLKVTPNSIIAGEGAYVEGTLTSTNALTSVNVSIWKGTTDVTSGKGFTVTQGVLVDDKKAWSLKSDGNVRVTVGGAAATGDYTVKVSAYAGNDSASATTTLTVTGKAVTTQEIVLGSNQNALGGSVDLDGMTVYSHADAKAISGKIDLYYAHSATGGDKLFTPAQAKESGFGAETNGPATWTVVNETEFRELVLSESAFAAITTQEAIDALWSGATAVTGGGDAVAEGATYIVNSDMAKKVLIRVTAIVPGDAGTVTVKGTK
jgi:hypothetical protein